MIKGFARSSGECEAIIFGLTLEGTGVVTLNRKMPRKIRPKSVATIDAFIGIGSNLNEPVDQVTRAIGELQKIPVSDCIAHSSLYYGPPMGPQNQPDYVNAVARLHTQLEPLALLEALLEIEQAHMRVRIGERWGARTLDLDLILYGDRQIADSRLIVPHPRLHERAFVLYPLEELAPKLHIPGQGAIGDLIAKCPQGKLRRLD